MIESDQALQNYELQGVGPLGRTMSMVKQNSAEFDDTEAEISAVADSSAALEKKERPPEWLAEAKAMEFLARREHSRAELITKLSKREHSAEAIEIALDTLAARGWQSDQRFAELFIEQRANRGKGPRVVRYELIKRGISSGDAADAMRDTEVDWQQVCSRTLANKFRADGDYAKMRRFLEQRGFDSAQARHAIRELQSDQSLID